MYKYFDYCHILRGITRNYKHIYRFSIFYKHVVSNREQWREGEVWFSYMGAKKGNITHCDKRKSLFKCHCFSEIVDQAAFYCIVTSVISISNEVYWFILPKEAAVT
jgi:hypothetical protein